MLKPSILRGDGGGNSKAQKGRYEFNSLDANEFDTMKLKVEIQKQMLLNLHI